VDEEEEEDEGSKQGYSTSDLVLVMK